MRSSLQNTPWPFEIDKFQAYNTMCLAYRVALQKWQSLVT